MSRSAFSGDNGTINFVSKAESMQRLGALLRSKGFEMCASKCDHAAATYRLASEFQAHGDDAQAHDITRRLTAPISASDATFDRSGGSEPPPSAAALHVTRDSAAAPADDSVAQHAEGRKMSMWL